jgi:sulfate adenylyltransferase subunit 1
MPWYSGPPLLELLETIDVHKELNHHPARFPIQYVIRPRTQEHHDYRGYAGRVASGVFQVGDHVVALPSGQKSVIESIHRDSENLNHAESRQSVTIVLRNDIDISRGDMLVKENEQPALQNDFAARICWLDREHMVSGKNYLLQHATAYSKAKISRIDFIQNPATLLKDENATSLRMNEIAQVRIRTARQLPVDRYMENPANGAFIMIDEHSNNTVAVGVIS